MKVIDQTPFYKDGAISLIDRGKAMMKFGGQWLAEVEAQKSVVEILEKILDKNYTLLRNVTPPGLGIAFPLILVGPPGVFVLYVASMTGMYRAKGDQWGTVSGNNFKPEKVNLLTRTDHMARAVQTYLQRQGYSNLTSVEAILICAQTGMYVDSLRPIIRVVMRDALERLAVSITQARVLLSPETVFEVVNRILTPPKAEAPKPEEAASSLLPATPAQDEEPYVPAFAQPEEPAEETEGFKRTSLDFSYDDNPAEEAEKTTPGLFGQPSREESSASATQTRPRGRRRAGISGKHWAFLIGMFVVWAAIILAFGYIILQDFH